VYSKYFGLKEPSFSIAADPHYLFLSEQHKEALAHLLYGAGESGGFVMLTGEVGTGKTTVCRAFLEQLPEGVDVALILNPAVTVHELLHAICEEFRIPVPGGEYSAKVLVGHLNRYLLDAHARGRRPVLIIDDAQILQPKVLEHIRLLTNLETTKQKLLQIFLIGQPELRRILEREELRQVDQRITARFHLRPFNLRETGEYIRHRLAVAGVERPLFSPSAIRHIYRFTGGVPRLINILCDRSLLGVCVSRGLLVSPAIVKKAAREVQGEPVARTVHAAVRPAVRPGFAAAAAIALLLAAGWLLYPRLSDEAQRGLALATPGEEAPGLEGSSRTPGADERSADPPLSLAEVVQPPATASPPGDDEASSPEVGSASSPLHGDAPLATADATDPPPEAALEIEATVPSGAVPLEPGRSDAGSSTVPTTSADMMARLAMSESEGLRLLLRRWGVVAEDLPAEDPCGGLTAFGFVCEQRAGTLEDLRDIDRPALVRVGPVGDDAPRYLVLGELDAHHGTLDHAQGRERVPIEGLEAMSMGIYLLISEGVPNDITVLGPGSSGDAVIRLRRLLAEATGSEPPQSPSSYYDGRLRRDVLAFQASRGLVPDGIVGPLTLVELYDALDRAETPRLNPLAQVAEPTHTDPVTP
jgi:general secretion pathway protein A